MKKYFYIILIITTTLSSCKYKSTKKIDKTIKPKFAQEKPSFKKNGELYFFNKQNEKITTIYVEIASDDNGYDTGLQFYNRLEANCGMLFAFPDARRECFWMKNTSFPLDFIFANDEKEIIDIIPNNKPYSLKSISTIEYIQYAIAVNAFFAEKYNLKIGDKIDYIKYK